MEQKAIKLIDMILVHEGGFANIKEDNGKMTYRGISRKYYPNWEGWDIIDRNMPLRYNQILKNKELEDDVRNFYYKYFYSPMKISRIDSLLISGHLLCHGVNAGKKTSIRLLQKSINEVYKYNIIVDGIIGNCTLDYVNNTSKIKELENKFINNRKLYYNNIVSNKPSQAKFLKGWINRVNQTTKACTVKNVFFTQHKVGNIFTYFFNLIWKIVKMIKK